MAADSSAPPPEHLQAPPTNGSRYDKLEERVRKLEDTVSRFLGVLSVIRWLVPSMLAVGGGVLVFFLGRCTS